MAKGAGDLSDPNEVDAQHVYEQLLENYPPKAIEWVKGCRWIGPIEVPLDRVDTDDEEKWAAAHEPARVKHFAKQIKNGDDVKAGVSVQEPGEPNVKVIDGHHRYLGAKKRKKPFKTYIGFVDKNGGPWDQTHLYQFHQGSDPANKAVKDCVAAGIAVLAQDTGRILMLQRGLPEKNEKDPAAGTWEFPGGCLEPGESDLTAAKREWEEETGIELPKGKRGAEWRSGAYHGFVWRVKHEADVPIHDGRDEVANPDDPDGDRTEALAWWDVDHLKDNPAVRTELRSDLNVVLSALSGGGKKAATMSKEAAGYRDGTDATHRCRNCSMFIAFGDDEAGKCTLVQGEIRTDAVCDHWEPKSANKGFIGKVGPHGYIHGWIKVGDGVDSTHLSLKKNGEVHHKKTGTVVGHVERQENTPRKGTTTFITRHADGTEVYNGVYKREALAAVAVHHNKAVRGAKPVEPEKALPAVAKPAVPVIERPVHVATNPHQAAIDRVNSINGNIIGKSMTVDPDVAKIVRSTNRQNRKGIAERWDKLTPEQKKLAYDAVADAAKNPVQINMDRKTLSALIADGRLKTLRQLADEKKNPKGGLYFEHRTEYEALLMGYHPNVPSEQWPIYGTVDSGNRGQCYGDVTVKLKDDVRRRTTVTVGDSLNSDLSPIAIDKAASGDVSPEHLQGAFTSLNLGGVTDPDWIASAQKYGKTTGQSPWIQEYMETQIHGGVSLDDIDSVEMSSYYFDEGEKLKALGVNVTYV